MRGGWLSQFRRPPPQHTLHAQDAVLREQPLQYNKEDLLSPCFVVFGRRTE